MCSSCSVPYFLSHPWPWDIYSRIQSLSDFISLQGKPLLSGRVVEGAVTMVGGVGEHTKGVLLPPATRLSPSWVLPGTSICSGPVLRCLGCPPPTLSCRSALLRLPSTHVAAYCHFSTVGHFTSPFVLLALDLCRGRGRERLKQALCPAQSLAWGLISQR